MYYVHLPVIHPGDCIAKFKTVFAGKAFKETAKNDKEQRISLLIKKEKERGNLHVVCSFSVNFC